jgi:hypothetical protein
VVNKHSTQAATNTNTTTPGILRLPVNPTDNDKPSQVKITHSDSSVQHDGGKWLNLELVDDVSISGNEGLKQSLVEVNWSTHAYENEHCKSCTGKHVDTKSPQKECLTGCTIDDWLEPANDWNQWKQPAYVEKISKLSSSLQNYSIDSLNEITDASETTIADCTSIAEKSKRSKIHKRLGKSNYMSKKGVKDCNRKRPIVVSDKKISASAATPSSSQSNVSMDKCCTDKITHEHLKQKFNGKCLTFQLIVSISFDHLKCRKN